MSEPFLPYARQTIDDADIAAVTDVLRGDFLTTGPKIAEFEDALAARLDVPAAVVCSNGTTALHLAAHGLDLGPDDAVLVPTVTFLATANVIRHLGAEVVFVDVDPNTGLSRPEDFAAALDGVGNLRPRALFPVHLAGQVADPTAIAALAEHHGLSVVEDACHAIGSVYGQGVGVGQCRHSTMACFSFHPAKTVTMGEGGAVTTRDPVLAERLRRLRNHGMTRSGPFTEAGQALASDGQQNPWYYEMQEVGHNFRATDFQCALGMSQLAKLDQFIGRREQLVDLYHAALEPLAPYVRPLSRTLGRPGWHLFVALIDFKALNIDRAAVMAGLRRLNIGTQVHYLPVHRQPYYRDRYGPISLPGADSYYERCLSLPLYPSMEDGDVGRVARGLAQVLGLG